MDKEYKYYDGSYEYVDAGHPVYDISSPSEYKYVGDSDFEYYYDYD